MMGILRNVFVWLCTLTKMWKRIPYLISFFLLQNQNELNFPFSIFYPICYKTRLGSYYAECLVVSVSIHPLAALDSRKSEELTALSLSCRLSPLEEPVDLSQVVNWADFINGGGFFGPKGLLQRLSSREC